MLPFPEVSLVGKPDLLANHILPQSYQVLGDGLLEIYDLQLHIKHGS